MAAQSEMGPERAALRNGHKREAPPDAAQARAAKRPIATDADQDSSARPKRPARGENAANLVPVVPDVGQYELSFVYVGESNYRRQYRIFCDQLRLGLQAGLLARSSSASDARRGRQHVLAHRHGLPVGLLHLGARGAGAAGGSRARAPAARDAARAAHQGNQNLDPANLFFDSESRAVQASATAEDDAAQAQGLAMQAKMMQMINRLQTTNQPTGNRAGGSGGRARARAAAHAAAALRVPGQRTVFEPILKHTRHTPLTSARVPCADRQQVVPGVRPPEARSDLVDLMRVVNDHVAAALGVPASVIFEGKFSSNSMSQLQLLNSTIRDVDGHRGQQGAHGRVARVLHRRARGRRARAAHRAALLDRRAARRSTTAGLIDIESGAAVRRCTRSGARPSEIAGAVKRRREADQDGTDTKLLEAQNSAKLGDADVRSRRAQTGKTTAETKVVEQQVAKTKAETKKTLHDAAAPHATPGAAGGRQQQRWQVLGQK